jgi:hypothetical protein
MSKSLTREHPSQSKPRISFKFHHEGRQHSATFGRFDDGRLAEIFIDGGAVFNTPARLASLLFQHGVDVETVRRAVIGGPLAIALDRIMSMDGPRDPESERHSR